MCVRVHKFLSRPKEKISIEGTWKQGAEEKVLV
jgi:hypothetical protein